MKRFFSILLITALLIGLTPLMGTVALAEEYATVTSTNGYGVRLREGPSKGYGVITKYDVGTTVVVLQRGASWSQIKVGETVGWMQNQYLNFGTVGSSSGSASGSFSYEDSGEVWSDNGLRVWLRSSPNGQRLQLYSPGTNVSVIERGSDWSRVVVGGQVGYMMSYYIKFDSDAVYSEDEEENTEPAVPTSGKVTAVSMNYTSPVVGDVLEAKVTPEYATVKYSWKVDDVELGTEKTFSVLTRYANQRITLTVTGTGSWTGTAKTTALNDVQISKGLKSVKLSNDAPVVGNVLSAVLQPSSAVVEYSWRVGGTEVSSDATYTVQASDVGKLIQLKVSGMDGYEGSVACSASAPVVSDKALQSVKLNKDYPVVGDKLSVTVLPAGASVKYTWTVDGEVVSTDSTYTVNKLNLGKQVKVAVEGANGYTGSFSAVTERVTSAAITAVSISNTKPVTGSTITASYIPASASADIVWYTDYGTAYEQFVGSGASLCVEDLWKDAKITVVATGTGVWSGEVSATTSEVISRLVLTSAKLDNYAPVVGEVLTATVLPEAADEAEQTYVWMIDNETATTHTNTYTVKESDLGKKIRVKVIGGGEYTGEVFSPYTNAVAKSVAITGVNITNETTGANAVSVAPEVGHKLTASVVPASAAEEVTYQWFVEGNKTAIGTGESITIAEKYSNKSVIGKKLTVVAKGNGTNYTGEKSATTAAVTGLTKLNGTLNIANPMAGITPVYSASIDKQCSGAISWEANGVPAVLDQFGCFKPNTIYTAVVKLSLSSGYTLTGVQEAGTLTIPGATAVTIDVKNGIVRATFPATSAKQQVTDFYISELAAPVVGERPEVYSFVSGTNQYASEAIIWEPLNADGTFANATKYTATFYIAALENYTLDGLEDNIFHVSGASSTSYNATSHEMKVTFNTERKLTVKTDKTEVLLDGYNSRVVQCTAELSNYVGKFDEIEWDIVEATVDGTSISPNGQLVIGMYEETGRTLTIRATVHAGGEVYTDDAQITIGSGTDTDTAIRVEFIKAPGQIELGNKGYFEAKVSNSTAGCNIFAIWGENNEQLLTNGWLAIDETETAKKVIIRAVSNEDHSVTASVIVDIVSGPDSGIAAIALPDMGVATLEVMDEGIAAFDGETMGEAADPYGVATMEIFDESMPAFDGITLGEEPVADGVATMEIMGEGMPAFDGETSGDEPAAEAADEDVSIDFGNEPSANEPAAEPAIVITIGEEIVVETNDEETSVDETATETEEPAADEPAAATEEPVADEPAAETEEPAADESADSETSVSTETDNSANAGIATMEILDQSIPAYDGVTLGEDDSEDVPAIVIVAGEATDSSIVVEEVTESEIDVDDEEDEEEELTGVAIAIKDTVTGEVIEEPAVEQSAAEETKGEEKKSSAKESKSDETEDEDAELDDLEDDKDIGESTADSSIKIRFVDAASSVKRGGSTRFAVSVEGSEQGVVWSVRRSADKNGDKVSSISEEGVLAVSKSETADKLIVVATSVEDGTVRARWIVEVKKASSSTSSSSDAEEEVVEETETVEETTEPEESADQETEAEEEAVKEETEAEETFEEEIKPEDEGLTEDQLRQIQEELDALEEENGILDLF